MAKTAGFEIKTNEELLKNKHMSHIYIYIIQLENYTYTIPFERSMLVNHLSPWNKVVT